MKKNAKAKAKAKPVKKGKKLNSVKPLTRLGVEKTFSPRVMIG